MLDIKS